MNIQVVAVGTESELKIRAVERTFRLLDLAVQILSCRAESRVGIQPVGMRNMENGARNRVKDAKRHHPNADLYIGIENGLVHQNDRWFDPTCVFVLAREGWTSVAFGAFFPIPEWIVTKTLQEKTELGEVIKVLAGGGEKDPMKYLSEGTLPREELLSQAVHCALAPILFSHRYKD